MSSKCSVLIFILITVKFSTSTEDFCQIKRDALKQEYEALLTTFNITEPNPQPSKCEEYQDAVVKTIDEIDEDSFLNQIKGEEFEEMRKKYQSDRDYLEKSFIQTKEDMKDDFDTKMNDITTKIGYAAKEIDRITEEEKIAIKKHEEMLETYDKCGSRSRSSSLRPYHHSRRFKASREQEVMCDITSQWFMDLKELVDTKVYSGEELLPNDSCNKKKKWFLNVNTIFQEAIDQISESYDIETYKATLEKRLNDRKKDIQDTLNQMTKDYERSLKGEADYLQELNAELQEVNFHFEELKKQQIVEEEVLGAKLIGCERYELANKLIDDVDSKDFMKRIFTREYENSSKNDKAENMMRFIGHVKDICRKFEGYIIFYDIITSKSHQESPTMIEIINQIRNLRISTGNCDIEYDPNNFISPTLVTDPIVDNILNIFADSVKVGSYSKIITFNYDYTMTFGDILSTLVLKSYTGKNMSYLLGFKDELYWLVHKYDLLIQLLDINPPTNDAGKKMFKESVDKTAKTEAIYNEDTDRLVGLRAKMKRYGIE